MKNDIYSFIYECDICQRNKGELMKPLGTLQPPPILASIWTYISMNYIMGLPNTRNKAVIMVVVNQLYKYAHFCALLHQFTLAMVAQLFLN